MRSSSHYPFAEIEPAWQARWEEAGVFHAEPDPDKPKWFVVELAPFANGRLHLGHVRNYTLADVSARFRRQAGFNVLYSSGFDTFGLPNDNAARAEGCHPDELARRNCQVMAAQFVRLGLSHDSRRIVGYHEPSFYRWVEYVFLKLLEHGLLARRERKVNWCARCETTVDEALVDDAGRCWRCETTVEGRLMKQWFALEQGFFGAVLDGLDQLEGWPAKVKDIQRQIIGMRRGVRVVFAVPGVDVAPLEAFLEAPELVPGIAFVGVGLRHAVVDRLRRSGRLDAATEQRLAAMDTESRGSESREERRQKYLDVSAIPLGIDVIHPLTGRALPLIVASAVDPWTDTAAMAGVPAHRRIDHRLSQSMGIEVRPVLARPGAAPGERTEAFEWDDTWTVSDDGPWGGKTVAEARAGIAAALHEKGAGGEATDMRIGPWHLSRQRYWSTPIPAVFCPACGPVPVPEADLPVLLPLDVDTMGAGNPLERHESFVQTSCPKCGGAARRDTDTLDVYFPAWWFLWTCKGVDHASPFTSEDRHYWMPVDLMVGGIEQSSTCFLHSRSLARMMVQMGIADHEEPIRGLLAIGMVKRDGEKMSKSKGNAEDSAALIESYGADALRVAMLMAASPERDFNWDQELIRRAHAFLGEVWGFVSARQTTLRFDALDEGAAIDAGKPMRRQLASWLGAAVGKTTSAFVKNDAHLAVKNVMALFESIARYEEKTLAQHKALDALDVQALSIAVRTLLVMMTPLSPHLCEELFRLCGGQGFIAVAPWPEDVRAPDPRGRRPKPRRGPAGP